MNGSPWDQQQPPPNRRSRFRCPVADQQQSVTLRDDQQRATALLLDESAGGFAVRTEHVFFEVGDTLRLETPKGTFEVCVANLQPIDPSAGAPEADGRTPEADADVYRQAVANAPYRAGLQLIRELDPCDQRQEELGIFRRLHPQTLLPGRFSMLTVGAITVAVGLGLPLLGLAMWWNSNRALTAWGKQLTAARPVDVFATNERPNWGGGGSGGRREPPGSARSSGERESSQASTDTTPVSSQSTSADAASLPATSELGRLRDKIRRAVGAQALLLSEVSTLLKLSDRQRREIGRIIKATNRALGKLRPDRHDPEALERTREQLLRAARRSAVEVLTPAQRNAFAQLESGSP